MTYKYLNYTVPYLRSRLADLKELPVPELNLINEKFIWAYINQPHYDQWVDCKTGKPCDIPAGTLVLDVETSDNTQTLALASCYHWEYQRWYYFVSSVGKYDNLLDIPDASYVIAHRAAFENSFIASNYSPSRPPYRSFCTYAYAASRLHALKPALFRAKPWIPMFSRSSDCSLSDLYTLATNKELDKSAVEMFIKSQGDQWRYPVSKNMLDAGLYELYLQQSKIPYDNLPEELTKIVSLKAGPMPRKKTDRLELLAELELQATTPSNVAQIIKLRDLLNLDPTYTAIPSVALPIHLYEEKLRTAVDDTQHRDRQGLIYNMKDVAATCYVTRYLIDHVLDEISDVDYEGMMIRLQPLYAIDPDFSQQVESIKTTYTEYKDRLQIAAEKSVTKHLETAGDWDGQDWSVNTKDRTKWYDAKKIGYSKTLNAIAARIHWKGLPLKRIKAPKPVKLVDGGFIFPDLNTDPKTVLDPSQVNLDTIKAYWAYETTPNLDLSYTDRLARMDSTNCTPFENPESTDPKEFKTVTNFFSRLLQRYWVDGRLTCGEPEIQKLIPDFISTAYWTSIQRRIYNLKIVDELYVAPRPSVHGTVSGRNVESVFLVMTKYDEKKIGAELAGMMVAPRGYKMFRFDLDSCQARVASLIADAWYAKEHHMDRVILGSTGISRAVLHGSKHDRTSLAHVLGDTYLGFDLLDPVQADKSYSLGKNAQFSLIFGVGADKLAKMLNIPYDLALKLVVGWKGVKDRETGLWSGGTASELINAQAALSRREYPSHGSAAVWEKHEDVWGVVTQTRMPHILNPRYSGKEYITTKYNATIQNGDVAFLNWILAETEQNSQHLDIRYNSSVHDDLGWFVREDQVEELKPIVNQAHRSCFEHVFDRWNVDLASVGPEIWYPSSIDVTQRFVKKLEHEQASNSKTLSFASGYRPTVWDDTSIDFEELTELDSED